MNCVRHEKMYDQEVLATWPRGSSARFCSEGCAAFYGLEMHSKSKPPVPTEKVVAPGRPHTKGHSTTIPAGDPTQAINRQPTAQPVAVATADGDDGDDGDGDGVNQGDAFDTMNKDELKAECVDRELPVSGNMDDLLARIRAHDEAEAAS